MKYIIIFGAMVHGHYAELADLDRVATFTRFRACWGYGRMVAPKMEAILRDHYMLDPGARIEWKCRRLQ
jgi:hypothetical protein